MLQLRLWWTFLTKSRLWKCLLLHVLVILRLISQFAHVVKKSSTLYNTGSVWDFLEDGSCWFAFDLNELFELGQIEILRQFFYKTLYNEPRRLSVNLRSKVWLLVCKSLELMNDCISYILSIARFVFKSIMHLFQILVEYFWVELLFLWLIDLRWAFSFGHVFWWLKAKSSRV